MDKNNNEIRVCNGQGGWFTIKKDKAVKLLLSSKLYVNQYYSGVYGSYGCRLELVHCNSSILWGD